MYQYLNTLVFMVDKLNQLFVPLVRSIDDRIKFHEKELEEARRTHQEAIYAKFPHVPPVLNPHDPMEFVPPPLVDITVDDVACIMGIECRGRASGSVRGQSGIVPAREH